MKTGDGNRKSAEKTFRVGDRVRFQLGVEMVEGVITEDRGAIGVGGRRLYRIEGELHPGGEHYPASPIVIELLAVDFEPVN
jgi:hypothetical protein